ncbi:MAG: hypothetical protein HND54_05205 [Bacteroidetes bacterium]|nr:hypothetical protein [Bacteroidota bacterium]
MNLSKTVCAYVSIYVSESLIMQMNDNNWVSKIKLDLYEISLNANGILYVYTFNKREETVEDCKQAIESFGNILNGKKAPMLFRHAEFSQPSHAVRKFWAKKDSNPYSIAESFIIDRLSQKLIGNFYLKINKPCRPTKLFTNEKDAVIWLSSFL